MNPDLDGSRRNDVTVTRYLVTGMLHFGLLATEKKNMLARKTVPSSLVLSTCSLRVTTSQQNEFGRKWGSDEFD